MKRRKALLGISLLAGGAVISYAGFKLMRLHTTPDLDYLISSRKLLASLVDVIIPETDSPAANACNVPEFIIKALIDCTKVTTQNKFITGLKELEQYCLSKYQRPFPTCSEKEKIQILTYFADKDRVLSGIVGKAQNKFLGRPFFTVLREYCVIGYFTSKAGATQALRYSHIPSQYIACQPYAEGEKGWATY